MRKKIGLIVFWGALWGIAEATIGYLLHMLPLNLGWVIWYPLAFFFMSRVRRQTGSAEAILFTAAIASAIKFVDVMLPGSIDRVVNPAVSIILESMAVYALYRFCVGNNIATITKYAGILASGFLWRALYAGYVLLLPVWMVKVSPLSSLQSLVEFLFVQSAVNGATIVSVFVISRLPGKRATLDKTQDQGFLQHTKTVLPYVMLALAVLVQRVL